MVKKRLILLTAGIVLTTGVILFASCSDEHKDIADKNIIFKKQQDSIARQKWIKDSTYRWNIFAMMDSIKEPHYWVSKKDSTISILIDIDTEPQISISYPHDQASVKFFDVDKVEHIGDSSVFTSRGKKDSIFIWTLHRKENNTGTWSFYKPQIKFYKKLGVFVGKKYS